MSNLNVAVLMGRLVADPELKNTSTGIALTKFSIAVDRNTKSVNKKADFFDIVAWRTTAEFICKYFKKGNPIIVEGRLQTGVFETKDGIKRKSFELVASNVYFAGGAKQTSVAPSDLGFSSGSFDESAISSDYSSENLDDGDLPF